MTSMVVSLTKGAVVELDKGVDKVRLDLSWGPNKTSGAAFDLDVSVFLTNAANKVTQATDFVFYNNLCSTGNAVVHSGDEKTGSAVGVDESVTVNFALLPTYVENVHFIVTIHDAKMRKQNFGAMEDSQVSVYNETDVSGAKAPQMYQLEMGYSNSTDTAVRVCSFMKKNGKWYYRNVSAGSQEGLEFFAKEYGLTVA